MFIMPTLSDNFNYNRVATRDEYCYKCLNFLYLDQGLDEYFSQKY